jgi:Ca-activated chloride channel family protein
MRCWSWLVLLLVSAACGREPASSNSTVTTSPPALTVLAGSENESLQPLVDQFAAARGVRIAVTYRGSVDIMLAMEDPSTAVDAVWPAASLWIDLGDVRHRVRHVQSIMRSPVVFAVKTGVAGRLGWVGRDVTVRDILAAAETGRVRYMMTSATQSNSGAAAYLGYLYSFAGQPDVLTANHLRDPAVAGSIRRLLSTVNRSAGSSGWLKDLFLEKFDQYDGMVNYESMVIEANRAMAARGAEPLYAVYPVDGLAIADNPLGYIGASDASKEGLFKDLQRHLLSPDSQREIAKSGRRVGLAAADASLDRSTFNPAWGIDPARVLTPVRWPPADVIRDALTLYQTSFRKPSITVYCLDYSGSMRDAGQDDLKGAMRILLDTPTASRYLLQTSARDITIVIPFNDSIRDEWRTDGNEPARLAELFGRVNALEAEGGTDIYSPVLRARDAILRSGNLEGYAPAIILMTDGRSENGMSLEQFERQWGASGKGRDIPVYSIKFGKADDTQLTELARLSSGRVFDGSTDLVRAFRQARGYN